jgi:L-asparaginase
LHANLERKDQTIILTGAYIPLNGFVFSDAPFNLGFAFAVIDSLKPGVYVCMNGSVLLPEEVVKLLKEGRFSSIFQSEASKR